MMPLATAASPMTAPHGKTAILALGPDHVAGKATGLRHAILDALHDRPQRLTVVLVGCHVGKCVHDQLYAAARACVQANVPLTVVADADQHTVLTSSGSPWPCQWEVEA